MNDLDDLGVPWGTPLVPLGYLHMGAATVSSDFSFHFGRDTGLHVLSQAMAKQHEPVSGGLQKPRNLQMFIF